MGGSIAQWSKGKVKDKANNAVVLDKATYDKILKDCPTYKFASTTSSALPLVADHAVRRCRFISVSVLVDRMKIGGSLARVAVQHLERDVRIPPQTPGVLSSDSKSPSHRVSSSRSFTTAGNSSTVRSPFRGFEFALFLCSF